jgi:hypothetical protein
MTEAHDNRLLLRTLIEQMLEGGIAFHVWGNHPKCHYRFVDIDSHGKAVRQIHIHKTNQQRCVYLISSSHSDLEKLISDSLDVVQDLVCLAHERGHSESPNKSITPLYTKMEQGKATPEEEAKIFSEEQLAWDWAHSYLTTEGFLDWERFEALKTSGLSSYGSGTPPH